MIIDKKERKLKCDECKKEFIREIKDWNQSKKCKNHFCDKDCFYKFQDEKIEIECRNCRKKVMKKKSYIKKTNNSFCSQSCAGTYSNTHKKYGTRRSKLEKYIEEELIKLYPNLEIHFNRKDAISSELDIYIPKLSLAFELNGIFHYEPIYGQEKLSSIQNNDNRKFAACHNANISLCVIDTSQQKYFKPKTSQKFLNIICDIINMESGKQRA